MPDAAELAFKNLERVLSRDPMLRDVLEQTVPKSKRGGRFTPDVDVVDLGSMYIALLDMPGIPKEHLNIELQGAQLIVTGKKSPIITPSMRRSSVVNASQVPSSASFCYPHRCNPTVSPRTCQTGCLLSRYQKLAMVQRRPYRFVRTILERVSNTSQTPTTLEQRVLLMNCEPAEHPTIPV